MNSDLERLEYAKTALKNMHIMLQEIIKNGQYESESACSLYRYNQIWHSCTEAILVGQVMDDLDLINKRLKGDGYPLKLAPMYETPKTINKDAVVYVMSFENGETKIGVTTKIEKRVKDLQRERRVKVIKCSHSVMLENAFEIEKIMHRRFSNKKIYGEYFNIDFVTATKKLSALLFRRHKCAMLNNYI